MVVLLVLSGSSILVFSSSSSMIYYLVEVVNRLLNVYGATKVGLCIYKAAGGS